MVDRNRCLYQEVINNDLMSSNNGHHGWFELSPFRAPHAREITLRELLLAFLPLAVICLPLSLSFLFLLPLFFLLSFYFYSPLSSFRSFCRLIYTHVPFDR